MAERDADSIGETSKNILKILGPGLVTGAADDDPSGIATYSQVGARFGYGVGWMVILSLPLMVAIQEIAAHIGVVLMRLLLEKAARKGLGRMPAKAADAMLARLERIAADPFGKHPNVTAMQGMKDCFRLRRGDWRPVYRIERSADEMRVIPVDVRGRTYR